MPPPRRRGKRSIYVSDRAVTALMVIEAVCENACKGPNAPEHNGQGKCFPCEIYGYAHSASACGKGHGWFKKTEQMFKEIC